MLHGGRNERVAGANGYGSILITTLHMSSYFPLSLLQVTFRDVVLQEDMILVARFYHWPSGRTAVTPWDEGFKPQHQPALQSEKWLAAWAVLQLTKSSESSKVMLAGTFLDTLGGSVELRDS